VHVEDCGRGCAGTYRLGNWSTGVTPASREPLQVLYRIAISTARISIYRRRKVKQDATSLFYERRSLDYPAGVTSRKFGYDESSLN